MLLDTWGVGSPSESKKGGVALSLSLMDESGSLISLFFVLGRKMRVAVVLKKCATLSLVTASIGDLPWAPMTMVMKTLILPQREWDPLKKGQKQNTPSSGQLAVLGLLPAPLIMIMNLCFPTRTLTLHHLHGWYRRGLSLSSS